MGAWIGENDGLPSLLGRSTEPNLGMEMYPMWDYLTNRKEQVGPLDVLAAQAVAWKALVVEGEATPDLSAPRQYMAKEARENMGVPDLHTRSISTDVLRDIICAPEFTWPCAWAEATVWCESGGNPSAHGTEWLDLYPPWGQLERYDFYGLFQVLGGSYDPYTNATQAHAQFVQWQNGQRARPWPSCP